MSDQKDDTDGLTINIPSSLLYKVNGQRQEAPKVTSDYRTFTRTNVIPIKVERDTEHGTTEVQSLGFSDHDQRLKILELLDTPALYNKLPELLEFIYKLGCEIDGEKRYYAAVAVSELAAKQPFSDLKKAIVTRWANSDNPWIRVSAAVALSQMLKQGCYESEVILLLKHWLNILNPMLTDTALSCFFRIAQSHPNETLGAIETISKNGLILHYQSVSDLFEAVYDHSPVLSIDQLHNWLIPANNSDLCWIAGLLFLLFAQMEDVVGTEDIRAKVVDIVFNLWDNPAIPSHQEIQELTTLKIEEWAHDVLALWNKESPEVLKGYIAFFHELYGKYSNQRRNRLEYHLQRWERNREREQVRANRGKRDASTEADEKVSYLCLMPQSQPKTI